MHPGEALDVTRGDRRRTGPQLDDSWARQERRRGLSYQSWSSLTPKTGFWELDEREQNVSKWKGVQYFRARHTRYVRTH